MRNRMPGRFMYDERFGGFFLEEEDNRDADLGFQHSPRHTKQSHPYSYDPFTIYGGPDTRANGSCYTDRLYQWDRAKTERIGKEVFGDGFWFGPNMDPDKVQTFLRRWHDDDTLVLTRVAEFCDGGGYPTWLLVWYSPKSQKPPVTP